MLILDINNFGKYTQTTTKFCSQLDIFTHSKRTFLDYAPHRFLLTLIFEIKILPIFSRKKINQYLELIKLTGSSSPRVLWRFSTRSSRDFSALPD